VSDNTPAPQMMPITDHPSGVVAMPPMQQQNVSVDKVNMPVVMGIALLTAVLGGVVSLTLAWGHTSDHVANQHVHIDEAKAIEGGGIAFRHDVYMAKAELKDQIEAESRKTRKLLRTMTLDCHKTPDGGFGCKVSNLPDPE
jgi:hypothetical protein